MKKSLIAAGALAAAIGAAGPVDAALVETPLPQNTYISPNGLDWAWANPLPAPQADFDLSFQAGFGWRLPTAAELAMAPLATDFVFAGANVPLGGVDPVSGAEFRILNADLTGAAACATPYFNASFRHCDWINGNGQPLGPWAQAPERIN